MENKNDTNKEKAKQKLETIKNGLFDPQKCKEFTEKLVEFISKDK